MTVTEYVRGLDHGIVLTDQRSRDAAPGRYQPLKNRAAMSTRVITGRPLTAGIEVSPRGTERAGRAESEPAALCRVND